MNHKENLRRRIVKCAHISEVLIDDEIVVMNISTGVFYALKGTGLEIWKLIDGLNDRAVIKHELLKRYAVDDVRCETEIDSFIEAMLEAKLVELC